MNLLQLLMMDSLNLGRGRERVKTSRDGSEGYWIETKKKGQTVGVNGCGRLENGKKKGILGEDMVL